MVEKLKPSPIETRISLDLSALTALTKLNQTIKEAGFRIDQVLFDQINVINLKPIGCAISITRPIVLKLAPGISTTTDRKYLLTHKNYGRYFVETKSWGGMFSEEGDQTLYSSITISKFDRKVPLRKLQNAQPEATMHISGEQNWEAGVEADYITGESMTCTITGRDKFLENFAEELKKSPHSWRIGLRKL
jgi:hypothetical protein